MGYDISCYDDTFIKAEHADAALAVLRKLAEERDDDGEVNTESWEDLVLRLSNEIFSGAKGEGSESGGLHIRHPEDHFRHEEEAESMFEALAPFLEGQSLNLTGEDGYEWIWSFAGGKLEHDHATKVWGDGTQKIAAFDKVLEILYPKGKVRTRFPKSTLDKLADVIRKSGFGPFANLNDLEALAKAAE
jgi:hypothetical protein